MMASQGLSQKMKRITEETLIPLGLVLIILAGFSWLKDLSAATEANTKEVAEVRANQEEYNKSVQTIRESIVRIETLLAEKTKRGE